jgi:hypothetical protein
MPYKRSLISVFLTYYKIGDRICSRVISIAVTELKLAKMYEVYSCAVFPKGFCFRPPFGFEK